jgi:hypothetical protein
LRVLVTEPGVGPVVELPGQLLLLAKAPKLDRSSAEDSFIAVLAKDTARSPPNLNFMSSRRHRKGVFTLGGFVRLPSMLYRMRVVSQAISLSNPIAYASENDRVLGKK